ncbi:beta-1,3-glucan-binding protein-like [Arctopsyche grandis]|uniref:beta-1,3-glucan-binding protein-like n=1 Tax=Arctopsyche grandis TaxID=121162 RepID=UPI00406D6F17
MLARLVFLAVTCFVTIGAQFVVPPIEIQALQPKGLRVAITDVPGIKLFGFHGKVNEALDDKENGNINGDVTQPENGRWIFQDSEVELRADDVLQYWVFVQHENYGYRKDSQRFDVKVLVPPNTPWQIKAGKPTQSVGPTNKPNCQPSKTTINNGQTACRGQLIFEDDFKSQGIDPGKWVIERRIPSDQQENEFVSYQKESVTIVGENIRIYPSLLELTRGFNKEAVETGTLDLRAGCTAPIGAECYVEAQNANILPPIISGKISTRNLFSFKYGKIEIKAKFPIGEWLYPELYLESAQSKYGGAGYDSGVMRVGFARGNPDLDKDGEKLNNKVLSGGVVLDQFDLCHSRNLRTTTGAKPWGDDYHTYGLIWDDNKITLQVDGKAYGTVEPPQGGFVSLATECPKLSTPAVRWKSGSLLAPFDEEFYVSIGLGVGGISDFPDNSTGKMWKNKSAKSKRDFWKKQHEWYNVWPENRFLLVDSVRIWAL